MPGSINSVNQILGRPIIGKIETTPKEIAISNTLLFSREARELKDEIIENSICANIFVDEGLIESVLIERILNDLGSMALNGQVVKAINRLKSKGKIKEIDGQFSLDLDARERIKLSRDDFELAKSKDVDNLMRDFDLKRDEAESLIKISLEILSRKESFDGDEPYSVQLQEFVAKHNLQRKRIKLYESLSKLTTAHVTVYGDAISHILSTNTYDIL